MSLKAWARYKRPEDMTTDIILALVLLALAVPLLMSLNNKGIATLAPSSSPSHDPKAAKPVQALRQAIIGQESNGQCSIQNKSGSGAAGLAQVMPENVSAWSREALGRSVSVSEFLKDCRLQLQVIDHKIAQYWQQEQGGSGEAEAVRRVASRWYAGQSSLYDNAAPQYWNGNQYPSIRDYTLSVLNKYRKHRAT